MDLTEQERAKYTRVWGHEPYRDRSPGLRHLDAAMAWMKPPQRATITDWGAGAGAAAEAMAKRGLDVRLVDIAANAYRGSLPFTEACLWELPADLGETEYGFCADVMEHIPTEHVDAVLQGIAKRTIEKCYFQIALFDDSHFTSEGRLHLTVKPREWWHKMLETHFLKCEYRMIRTKHLLALCE